ncbi:MAG: two-component regulator propeller domain-containing protein, partial [Gemmatimonadota bacterium]
LLLAGATPAAAHNGRLALAFPMAPITVDGDLSDWPAGAVPYPIRLTEYGLRPADPSDCEAYFLVGYSGPANSLYLAVEVHDQSVVVGPPGADQWNTADGCEVTVDYRQHGEGSEPLQQYVYGATASGSATPGHEAAAEVAWVHGDGCHRYEWRVDLGAVSQGAFAARPGQSLGLDVAVTDQDADSSFTWLAWGKGVAKYLSASRMGDVVLVASDAGVGRLRGWTRRKGTDQPIAGRTIHVRGAGEEPWVHLETDADGNYAAELPTGQYLVDLGPGVVPAVRAAVRAGHDTEVTFPLPPAAGRRVAAGPGHRVEAGHGLRQGPWHSLSPVDGLPGNTVRAVLQGRDGYLWIGTESGLSRFDGRYLVNYDRGDGLVADEVRCLAQDTSGVVWIGTSRGLSRFDGHSFTTFADPEGLPSDEVRALASDAAGHLWIGTDAGLAEYDSWDFTSYARAEGLPGSQVRSLALDSRGGLWMGVWGRGASRYDGRGFATLTSADGLLDNQVRPILEDRDRSIWIGTESGLSRWDGQTFRHYTHADGLPDSKVWSLFQDRSGDLWVGTENGGASRFDGSRFVTFTSRDGLAGDWVWSFAEDREGVLWVATAGGVSRFDARFATYTTDDGLPHNTTNALIQDRRGDLWLATGLGTAGGLARYDGQSWHRYTAADGLPHSEAWAVLEDRGGGIWVGTSRGVARFDGSTFSSMGLTPGLVNGQVTALAEDGEGAIWIATATSGAVRYAAGQATRYTAADGLAHNRVLNLAVDRRGGVWLTTLGGGVSRFDGHAFTTLSRAEGLASDTVWAAAEDGDRLWLGTPNGLCRYQDGRFTTYTTADGLAGNRVRALLVDSAGQLWAGTDAGLSRFDGQVFQTLLRRDGLASNGVRALLQARDGAIWVGTMGGTTRYETSVSPPPVVLTDVITDGRQGPLSAVELRTTQDYLAFEFTGISFKTRPEAMVYRYRLQGHDPGWRVTRSGRAEYGNLESGRYTFEVEAVDRDLAYSPVPARAEVRVRPAYGRLITGAALALALALITWQAAAIVRGHRRLRRAHDDLELRVEERTTELRAAQDQLVMQEKMASLGSLVAGVAHEINNPVGAVNSAADVSTRCLAMLLEALDQAGSLEELRASSRFARALELLEQNNRITLTGTERIRQIVGTLRSFARLDQAELQRADLHEGLDSTLALLHYQLKGRIRVVKEYGDLPRIYCYPQELNQVFMNLLSNAIHAIGESEGEIRIATRADGDRVLVTIADTGGGIAPEIRRRIFDPGFTTKTQGVGTGLGLAISYRIVARHHGEIRLDSEVGRGSTFTVVLPRHLHQLLGRPA